MNSSLYAHEYGGNTTSRTVLACTRERTYVCVYDVTRAFEVRIYLPTAQLIRGYRSE